MKGKSNVCVLNVNCSALCCAVLCFFPCFVRAYLPLPAEWYEFARSTVERYQQETVRAEEDQKHKKREETMKLIREELSVLCQKQDSLTKLEFLKFVYKTYPPKNPEHKLGEVRAWKEK